MGVVIILEFYVCIEDFGFLNFCLVGLGSCICPCLRSLNLYIDFCDFAWSRRFL